MADGALTPYAVALLIIVHIVALVKVWPLVKAKLNDARKIELDADADLRGDLLGRIRELETARDGEPQRIDAAIGIERRRCDAELAEMRLDYNRKIDGLERTIAQNSRSAAHLIGDPGKLGSSGNDQ